VAGLGGATGPGPTFGLCIVDVREIGVADW
jgi:hypothetical protein